MLTVLKRLVGALALNPATFEEIEHDTGATGQALVVVVLASLGAAIGNARSWSALTLESLFLGTLVSLIAWVSWALLLLYLGTRLMPTPETRADAGELLRTVGFAAAPGVLRAVEVTGFFPSIWFPVSSLWMIAATTVAVRQALDYTSLPRAVGVCALGWFISLAIAAGIGILFSTPVS